MTLAHIMLDIETLGTRPGFVVLSAAFVRFTDLQHTTLNLSVADQTAIGLEIDTQTHTWWGEQYPAVWAAATQGAHPLRPVLEHFAAWLQWASAAPAAPAAPAAAGGGELAIWCHGAGFDAPILQEVYRRAGLPCPWSFRSVRCTRTLYDLAGVDPRSFVTGRPHVALDDAIGQTRAAVEALRVLAAGEEARRRNVAQLAGLEPAARAAPGAAVNIAELAQLAVENGEAGAQLEIKDAVLRESLVVNVSAQMERIARAVPGVVA